MPVPVCLSGPCRAPPRRRCSSARPHHRLPGPYRSSDRATPRFTFLSAFASSSLARVSPRLVSPRFASPRLAAPRLTATRHNSPRLASTHLALLLPCHAAPVATRTYWSFPLFPPSSWFLRSFRSSPRFVSFLNPLVPSDQYRSRYLANHKFRVIHADDF